MGFNIVKLTDPIQFTNVTGGLVPRGAYNAGTDYAVGDSVSYNGSSYVMHTDAVAGVVPTDTTKWQVLANQGPTGANGAAGQGIPTGGTAGQVLSKIDGTNYNTQWSSAGAGDMAKAVYDTNNNGIVDNSELLQGQNSSYHLSRANHTGSQAESTITNLVSDLAAKADKSFAVAMAVAL